MKTVEITSDDPQDLLDQMAHLVGDGERRQFFERRPDLVSPEQVEALCVEVARQVSIDAEKAIELAATSRWLADRLSDLRCRALSARAAANAYHFAGDQELAQQLYETALDLFIEIEDELAAAITRSSALHNLAYLGDYDKVQLWEGQARKAFEHAGDRLRLAILNHNRATVHMRQDNWQEALVLFRSAHEEFQQLERSVDAAICLRNVAVCQINLHLFEEALEVYQQSRAYCAEQGLARLVMEVDYNIAYLYYLRGEYTRAIGLFQVARQESESLGDDYHQRLCDLDQSELYLELNLVDDAADLARSAFRGFDRLKVDYESAKALTNHALAVARQGDAAQALKLLEKARRIFVRENNHLWPALIDFYRAVVLARQDDHAEQATVLAHAALQVFADSSVAPRAVMCEILLSRLALQLEDLTVARDYCRAALERLQGLELPALEHQAYLMLGQVEEASGDPGAALEALKQSHGWLERLRSQLQGEDLKIAFFQDKQEVYESLVWLLMGSAAPPNSGRDVFDYMEKAKSRGLADLMAFRANALEPKDKNPVLAEKVRTLREELNWFYRQIDQQQMLTGETARREVSRFRRSARVKEDELLRDLRRLQTSDREYSSLQSASMVDLATCRSTLPPAAVLVEYFIARETVFAAVVDADHLEVVAVTSAPKARQLHRALQFQLSRAGRPSTSRRSQSREGLIEKATHSHLRDLFRELIEPIRHLLDRQHLILAPHGFLHYLPFHALASADGKYLSDLFTISYAPSASVFHLCASKEVTYDDDRSLVLGVADQRAPEILHEVRTVADSLPGAVLLEGEAASEDALRQRGSGCRFLHIATHGVFRRDNPMFSAIQLGTSRLSLFDLYNLRLDAELIVLSGCGTGLNAVLGADELVGLTRGLLYAGAHSVLVTLWDVHDASTAVFMGRFYRHIAAGIGRLQALHLAMKEHRQEYPQPYYWAPFILVGNPG